MLPSTFRPLLLAGVLFSALSLPIFSPSLQAAAKEAAPAFPAEVIEDVIVPMPSEIFLVLDKLGRPDWRNQLRSDKPSIPSARLDVSLLLGVTVAEGFVAVQAQDETAVERVGKDVLKLASALGLKDTVLPHTNNILDASKKGHWEIVRVELDKTQKTVRDTMETRRDADMAQCVSLGGWLRGTEAVTAVVQQNYTSDSAELLNQPDIIKHFQKALGKLGNQGRVPAISQGLGDVARLIGTGDEAPSAEGVKAVHQIVARLVKQISIASSSPKK